MITLSTERGLVRVGSWDDVMAVPGFVDGVDHKVQTLQAIIGRYLFPEKRPCGLASCRTPHGRGFIVDIGGGQVTNIGKDCGKTHFGVDFETMSRAFVRDDLNASRRERLRTFQFEIPELRRRIDEIRQQKSGDWIVKTAKVFRSTECPAPVREAISKMVRARDNRLLIERMETQAEADVRAAMSSTPASERDDGQEDELPRRRLVTDTLASVEGLSIFYPEFDVRSLLILDVLPRLKVIEELTVAELGDRELRDHVKWIGTTEEKLGRAVRAIEEGRRFLNPLNLQSFKAVLRDPRDLKAFNRLTTQMIGGHSCTDPRLTTE